ncbi:MAG TPA: ABC transporter permease [Firmicutes bacterium]|jgi:multiple sugar transport system permease protein|nr:ABC transporter permease [Bacillota bacterium]HBR34377.1 ABC transporter permease [Bacillota bacterium]
MHIHSIKRQQRLGSVSYHFFVIILGFFVFYPVLWLIASSLKGHTEIFQKAHSLIPSQLLWENYVEGWRGFGGNTFGRFFSNSLFISTVSTAGQLAAAALTAFGFSRVKFVGRKFWFGIMIATLLLPNQVLMIPRYILFNQIRWIDSYKPLIIPHFFAAPFFVFLIIQFIYGIPRELDEAATIDGCGKFSIFYRIILPNLKPPLISAGIFSFYWTWNDFFGPLLYIQTVEKYPASLALQLFSDPNSVTNWGGLFAMATLSLVPVFLIFLSFQRHLVEGISTTGLKG